jgi:transcriptional antiterminator NusG
MYRWYVINTRSNLEKKVKGDLERRLAAHDQSSRVRQIVIPTETKVEVKDGEKIQKEERTMPGYVLINMDLNPAVWAVVKETPNLTGFVGASTDPVPLTQPEVDRLLHQEVAQKVASKAQFTIGESVKVVAGPLSDFSGEIAEINQDAAKLKVLVSIFGRETPVEVGFDQVKKI